jgi:katanin p80 WD40 repeat-containing subunit B1
VSTTDHDVGAISCITFSQGAECANAYAWKPAKSFGTIPMQWGNIQDVVTAHNQLIGACFHLKNGVLYAVVFKRVHAFGWEPAGCSSSPFVHGQSVRKIFSQEKPLIVSKVALHVKTSEVYDIWETDPEDESQSVADI